MKIINDVRVSDVFRRICIYLALFLYLVFVVETALAFYVSWNPMGIALAEVSSMIASLLKLMTIVLSIGLIVALFFTWQNKKSKKHESAVERICHLERLYEKALHGGVFYLDKLTNLGKRVLAEVSIGEDIPKDIKSEIEVLTKKKVALSDSYKRWQKIFSYQVF